MVQAIRGAQIADQIRDYVAVWSASDLAGIFFTVTMVTIEPNLRHATIWVAHLRDADEKKIMSVLRKNARRYRGMLLQKLQRRHVPELRFEVVRPGQELLAQEDFTL